MVFVGDRAEEKLIKEICSPFYKDNLKWCSYYVHAVFVFKKKIKS